eukprot:gene6477-15526_t
MRERDDAARDAGRGGEARGRCGGGAASGAWNAAAAAQGMRHPTARGAVYVHAGLLTRKCALRAFACAAQRGG